MALRRLAPIAVVAVLTAAAACSSSTSPHGTPSGPLTFPAGNGQTDTINAILNQALVARINRAPVAGQVIQFVSVMDSAGSTEAYVEPLSSPSPQSFVAETTDASGEAGVEIVLGSRSGTAHVLVRVPRYGWVDTATFTVKPGQPHDLVVAPRDTTLVAGSQEQVRVNVVDRGGNTLPMTATGTVISGTATVSGTTVSATTPTRASVVFTANGDADTIFESFVPSGALAGGSGTTLTLVGLDGSQAKQVTLPSTMGIGNMKFAPDGAHLVWDQSLALCDATGSTIIVGDLSGHTQIVDQSGGANQYPSYSRDGTWIYYSKLASSAATWRVHPDGSADDSVATLNPSVDLYPSSSPDGQRVAYLADNGGSSDLRVLTLSTGAVTSLGVSAWSPEWSPTTNQIAYITGATCEGTISIVNADGSGNHQLTTAAYFSGFDWSPDGKWLIAIDSNGLVDLIDATSGKAIPLTWATAFQFGSVSWKPR